MSNNNNLNDAYLKKLCPKGHQLEWSDYAAGKYVGGSYKCNVCSREFRCEQKRWLCNQCLYDVCKYCAGPPHIRKEINLPPTKNKEGEKCRQGHILEWSTREVGSRNYRCSTCKIDYECCGGRWICQPCDLNVCAGCTGSLTCEQGGKLLYIQSKPQSCEVNLLFCDVCEAEQSYVDGVWHCDHCDYDLCNSCTHKKAVINKSSRFCKELANGSRALSGSQLVDEMNCKICYERRANIAFIPCGHTFCESCAQSMAECPNDRRKIDSKLKLYF